MTAQLSAAYTPASFEGYTVRAPDIDLDEIKCVLDVLPSVPSSIKLYAIHRP